MDNNNVESVVKEAINEAFSKLPSKIKKYCKENGIKIQKFDNKDIFHFTNGCVSRYHPNIIKLNFFNMKDLSKDSIKGVFVHELGHSYIINKKDWWSNLLLPWISDKKKFGEERADSLAVKWGFKKELKKLENEANFKRFTIENGGNINVFEELKKIKEDEKRVDIYLKCDKCGLDYKIEYYFTEMDNHTFLTIFRKDKIKGRIQFKYPINYKKAVEFVICIDCNKDLRIVDVNKNPRLY